MYLYIFIYLRSLCVLLCVCSSNYINFVIYVQVFFVTIIFFINLYYYIFYFLYKMTVYVRLFLIFIYHRTFKERKCTQKEDSSIFSFELPSFLYEFFHYILYFVLILISVYKNSSCTSSSFNTRSDSTIRERNPCSYPC